RRRPCSSTGRGPDGRPSGKPRDRSGPFGAGRGRSGAAHHGPVDPHGGVPPAPWRSAHARRRPGPRGAATRLAPAALGPGRGRRERVGLAPDAPVRVFELTCSAAFLGEG